MTVFMTHLTPLILESLLRLLAKGYFLMAFTEYFTHRWMLHRVTFVNLFPRVQAFKDVLKDHASNHHGRFYKCFNHEEDPFGREVGLLFPLGYYQILWVFVALPLLFLDWELGVGFAAWAYVHYKMWNLFHTNMHVDVPVHPLWRLWYKLVEFQHFMHHQHKNRNFAGLMAPLMDLIFLTLVLPTKEDMEVWRLLQSGHVVDRKGRPLSTSS